MYRGIFSFNWSQYLLAFTHKRIFFVTIQVSSASVGEVEVSIETKKIWHFLLFLNKIS